MFRHAALTRPRTGEPVSGDAVFVRELATEIGHPQVATVGRLELHPNLVNVVPARATLTVDLRNTSETALQEAEARLDRLFDEAIDRSVFLGFGRRPETAPEVVARECSRGKVMASS